MVLGFLVLLVWLEREVGDPKAASRSWATFLAPVVGTVHSDAENKAVAHRVVAVARKHRYLWQRDDFRKWARGNGLSEGWEA